jgi:hypothetical protein
VDSVDVSLAKGLASVKMKPGNMDTISQLQQAITKNGFTMKDSQAVVAGTLKVADGKAQLQVSRSNEILMLTPDAKASGDIGSLNGKTVVVAGVVPESAKGKAENAIRYRTLEEEGQSK